MGLHVQRHQLWQVSVRLYYRRFWYFGKRSATDIDVKETIERE